MNTLNKFLRTLACVLLCALTAEAAAQAPQPEEEPVTQAEEPAAQVEEAQADESPAEPDQRRPKNLSEVVAVGGDATVSKGEVASDVVSVFGSSRNDGEVFGDLVSVAGNTTTTGPVHGGAVAVLGNVTVNSDVHGDVVSVFGNVRLGPQANVRGQVVSVGGRVIRDENARIAGGVQQVLASEIFDFTWIQPWLRHAVFLGRPLAFQPGLGWAWGIALGFLALYALLAVMFRSAVEEGVRTLENYPGKSVLTSLAVLFLTPVGIVLLLITVIGIVLVPFVGLALLVMGLFGKAVVLATLGRRITVNFGDERLQHPALAVLIGGVLVLLLYVVPILGFIVYKVLGILGTGVVAYALILRTAEARRVAAANASPPPSSPPHAAQTAASAGLAAAAPLTGTGSEGSGAADEPAQTSASAQPSAPVTAAMPRAGFWIRMGALLIDALLISVVTWLLNDFADSWWALLLAGYGALMWKLRGTTVGGIIFGLRVVRLDGREMDWPTAVVRALSCFLSAVVAFLGFIWIAFDPERQAWHDKIAGTVVVLAPKGASLV
jgi:uncharacterized RDD family membrane protein YckC